MPCPTPATNATLKLLILWKQPRMKRMHGLKVMGRKDIKNWRTSATSCFKDLKINKISKK
jgi:hypothetical protein